MLISKTLFCPTVVFVPMMFKLDASAVLAKSRAVESLKSGNAALAVLVRVFFLISLISIVPKFPAKPGLVLASLKAIALSYYLQVSVFP